MHLAALACLVAAQQAPTDQPLPSFQLGRTAGVSAADDGRPVAVGPDWIATFDERGATFVPALGQRAPRRQDLVLEARELRRGSVVVALTDDEPELRGDLVVFERAPGIEERFEAKLAGLEHTFLVAGPVGSDGDLVVRVDLGGEVGDAGARRADGSHRFLRQDGDDACGGVSYGRLFGIDANGTRCDGDVRLVPGGLELVLPGAFVDRAAWPILLDPVVGAAFGVSDPAPGWPQYEEFDTNPSVAFDDTTNTYMAIWERRYAANNDILVHYQRFDANGASLGSQLPIAVNFTAQDPRVVGVNGADRFVATWLQDNNGTWEIRARSVDAASGALSSIVLVGTTTSSTPMEHDLAGESQISGGAKARAFVVWNHPSNGVQLARLLVTNVNTVVLESTTVVAPDPGLFESIGRVRIARSTSANGRMGVAWIRHNGLAITAKVYATVIDRTGAVLHTPQLVSGGEDEAMDVDIDGGGANPTRYVVAWTAEELFFPTLSTQLGGAALASDASLVVQPAVSYTAPSAQYMELSVGWRSGVAMLAVVNTSSIREYRIDPVSGALVGSGTTVFASDFSGPVYLYAYVDVELCMCASGGDASETLGVAVVTRRTLLESDSGQTHAETVRARFVTPYSAQATAIDLGGGCGSVGTISAPQAPGLGNGTFTVELAAAPTATFGILNLAPPQSLLSCGACSFAAPATTYLVPISGQSATVNLPIPATGSLAGAKALVQWYVLAPGAAPCAFVPDFGATNVIELTVN